MEFTASKNGRLDVILTDALPKEYSRHRIKKGIEGGAVSVNGTAAKKAGIKVKVGDLVTVNVGKFPRLADELRPVPDPSLPLDIVYEDEDCLVVVKPSGLLTHPTPTRLEGTLAGALIARYPAFATVGESPMRPGIVHRLDEGTSGLLVVAKTQSAFEFLKHQFMGRSVRKAYFALVEGIPEPREGVIEYAIRPSMKNPAKRVAVRKPVPKETTYSPIRANWRIGTSVREAETRYRVVETFGNKPARPAGGFALLELHPKTGRTHQIRVHLAAIGHPVVGDTLYGSKTPAPRQLLHAARLEFVRPNHKPISLDAPLPKDFEAFLTTLR